MSHPKSFAVCAAALAGLALAPPADSQEVVRLGDLTFAEGVDPALGRSRWLSSMDGPALLPRASVRGRQAFVGTPQVRGGINADALPDALLALPRDSAEREGVLYLPDNYGGRLEAFPFTIEAGAVRTDEDAWNDAVARHYLARAGTGLPGAPWFRRQARAHGGDPETESSWGGRRGFVGTDAYAMFTGGRALAENLRLDDVIRARADGDANVRIDAIDGVRVPAMEFDRLPAARGAELDALASWIPEDQHAVFFPTFDALVRVADGMADESAPLVTAIDGRGVDQRVRERYERQMLLGLDTLTRAVGGNVVESVALTGSDPYLRTGADLGLLFLCKDAAGTAAIRARMAANQGRVDPRTERVEGTEVTVWETPQRTVSARFAALGNVAVVTNSGPLMERLLAQGAGRAALPGLTESPEYRWFRTRYALEGDGRDALVVVTDAAIRRWSGPHWRIATARRIHAGAFLADADAWRIASAAGVPAGDTPPTQSGLLGGGEIDLAGGFAFESVYGTRDFLTPIAELEIDRVTEDEKVGYERWRRSFERSWGGSFDPIALGVDLRADGVDLDLTVVPLTRWTSYDFLMDMAGRAHLTDAVPGPHDGALVHFTSAIDLRGSFGAGLRMTSKDLGLPAAEAWCGDWVALWIDDDEEYMERVRELAAADEFVDEMLPEFPVGFGFAVSDVTVARGVLDALLDQIVGSGFLDVEVERRTHGDGPYVALVPGDKGFAGISEVPTLYAAVTSEAMVFSLSERTVKGAIDRAGRGAPTPWVGRSAGLYLDGDLKKAVGVEWLGATAASQLRARSWGNLAILNEWKRLGFEDPVRAHETMWGTRLRCPGGGGYVWNSAAATMESTVYGSPAAPIEGPALPPGLGDLRSLSCSLTFEEFDVTPPAAREGQRQSERTLEAGLRARIELRR